MDNTLVFFLAGADVSLISAILTYLAFRNQEIEF